METHWGGGFNLDLRYIKVALPSPQNGATLHHTTHGMRVLFLSSLYLEARVSPLKIALGEIQILMDGTGDRNRKSLVINL